MKQNKRSIKKVFTVEVSDEKIVYSNTLAGLEKKVEKLRKKSKYKRFNVLYMARIVEHSTKEI